MRDRAFRRHHLKRIKEKVRFITRYIKGRWEKWGIGYPWSAMPKPPVEPGKEDPRVIGIQASTHGVPCSCDACCNPRRSKHVRGKDRLTKQEKVAIKREQEQLEELED